MVEPHPGEDPVRVEEEAADWIARLNAPNASDEDRARCAVWRAADPSHERTFGAMSALWSAYQSSDGLIQSESSNCPAAQRTAVENPARRRWVIGVSSAAGVLAAAAIYSNFSAWLAPGKPETIFQTGVGEHVSIALPDQSRLELNSNTRVRVVYSAAERQIQIARGEAFFSVTPNPSRPFWVVGGKTAVRAIGTAFGVYLLADRERVTVTQGQVQLATAASSTSAARPISLLKAGQQADVTHGAATVHTVSDEEIARALAWRSGMLLFDGQRLGDVVQELRRYTDVEFVVTDESVRRLEIGGSLPAGPKGAQALSRMLVDGFGLDVRREGQRIYIGAPAPSRSH